MTKILREKIEQFAVELWQGKGVDVQSLSNTISEMLEIFIAGMKVMELNSIEFPEEYIYNALDNFKFAIEQKDDYLLADCLYYEWIEISIVFDETMENIR